MADERIRRGMQIGDVSRRAGVSARAVRYYEELGLLHPEGHSEGGFRLYGEQSLQCLEVISRLKELGLSLHEIRRVLAATECGSTARQGIADLIRLLNEKAAHIDDKIRRWREMQEEIRGTLELLQGCVVCERPALLNQESCRDCAHMNARVTPPPFFEVLLQRRTTAVVKAGQARRPRDQAERPGSLRPIEEFAEEG